jgi:hypothetical protein
MHRNAGQVEYEGWHSVIAVPPQLDKSRDAGDYENRAPNSIARSISNIMPRALTAGSVFRSRLVDGVVTVIRRSAFGTRRAHLTSLR